MNLPRLACLFFSLCFLSATAQQREFRGMWIATVKNIDWPSQPGLTTAEQQKELLLLLDSLQSHGFNAVILQVRPAGDAFYESNFEPWSEWLTGRQGVAPRPFYDPLQFAIREAHARNMELHAWVNPFRASMSDDSLQWIAPEHILSRHPEWTVSYGGKQYIDPGVPPAREYVKDVILDIIERYDIDALHFDDYFYPYKVAGQDFPDSLSWRYYGGRFRDIDAWRRDNVDQFIYSLHQKILESSPTLKFGISPFAVWRNKADDPEGSDTRAGITSYDGLHADIRKWMRLGWIDYVAPQIYFSVGYAPADYEVLLRWWEQNSYGKHLYIGHSAYKVNNNSDRNWEDPKEIPRQLNMVRASTKAEGSIFFSAKWLQVNALGWADSLQQHYYSQMAIPPGMPWLDHLPPLSPAQLTAHAGKTGVQLLWLDPRNPDAAYYCLYRTEGKAVPLTTDQAKLIAVLRNQGAYFEDRSVQFGKKYHYLLTASDAHHNESDAIIISKRYWRGLFRR